MTGTCYTGCSPHTTAVTHAPAYAHLAFTGAGPALGLAAELGLCVVGVGLLFTLWAWIGRGSRSPKP